MNKLICGDCSLELKKLPERCVDLVCTDPPYIVAARGRGLARGYEHLKEISARGMEEGFDLSLLNEFLRELSYILMGDDTGRNMSSCSGPNPSSPATSKAPSARKCASDETRQ